MNFSGAVAAALFSCLLALSVVSAAPLSTQQPNSPDVVTIDTEHSYYVEISIGRNVLTLFEQKGAAGRTPIAEYSVGTAVRGLHTYPLGLGKVTGIYFNPWWYPTPYSRQVFRERGIELPRAVPPGDPLNYMGPFKIALSFRFQIEDAVKAARDEATEAYIQYVEEPKTSQRRGRFDLELELAVVIAIPLKTSCCSISLRCRS